MNIHGDHLLGVYVVDDSTLYLDHLNSSCDSVQSHLMHNYVVVAVAVEATFHSYSRYIFFLKLHIVYNLDNFILLVFLS